MPAGMALAPVSSMAMFGFLVIQFISFSTVAAEFCQPENSTLMKVDRVVDDAKKTALIQAINESLNRPIFISASSDRSSYYELSQALNIKYQILAADYGETFVNQILIKIVEDPKSEPSLRTQALWLLPQTSITPTRELEIWLSEQLQAQNLLTAKSATKLALNIKNPAIYEILLENLRANRVLDAHEVFSYFSAYHQSKGEAESFDEFLHLSCKYPSEESGTFISQTALRIFESRQSLEPTRKLVSALVVNIAEIESLERERKNLREQIDTEYSILYSDNEDDGDDGVVPERSREKLDQLLKRSADFERSVFDRSNFVRVVISILSQSKSRLIKEELNPVYTQILRRDSGTVNHRLFDYFGSASQEQIDTLIKKLAENPEKFRYRLYELAPFGSRAQSAIPFMTRLLREKFKKGEKEEYMDIIGVLSQIGGPEVIPQMMAALQEVDAKIRYYESKTQATAEILDDYRGWLYRSLEMRKILKTLQLQQVAKYGKTSEEQLNALDRLELRSNFMAPFLVSILRNNQNSPEVRMKVLEILVEHSDLSPLHFYIEREVFEGLVELPDDISPRLFEKWADLALKFEGSEGPKIDKNISENRDHLDLHGEIPSKSKPRSNHRTKK